MHSQLLLQGLTRFCLLLQINRAHQLSTVYTRGLDPLKSPTSIANLTPKHDSVRRCFAFFQRLLIINEFSMYQRLVQAAPEDACFSGH